MQSKIGHSVVAAGLACDCLPCSHAIIPISCNMLMQDAMKEMLYFVMVIHRERAV